MSNPQWQKMETAPTDGSSILAYFPLEGCGPDWLRVMPVHYREKMEPRPWVFAGRASASYGSDPTHWMPLPEAPEAYDLRKLAQESAEQSAEVYKGFEGILTPESDNWLIRFVAESNKIEGITRQPSEAEIEAHEKFLSSAVTIILFPRKARNYKSLPLDIVSYKTLRGKQL